MTREAILRYSCGVLEKYFAEGPYRFQMHFGRGAFADFSGPTSEHEEILSERRHWLQDAEERCLVIGPGAEPLIAEALQMAQESGTVPAAEVHGAKEQARFLGEHSEPDYMLLTKGEGIRLVCGCICFPSSWSVEEKLGRRIDEIHEIVPALNSSIGRQIQTFLERIKPGVSWTRSNWGLSRSLERNQHPGRKLRRLDSAVEVEEVYFRVEEQSLVALPKSEGILFGIRIKVIPLREFIGNAAGQKLRSALETMPEQMARYKGISAARERLLSFLT